MNPFKRVFISINASLEQFVVQVENHEALADSAIRDVESAAIQARTQLDRLRMEARRTTRRLEELQLERKNWISRARKKTEEQNEQLALECVRRLEVAEAEASRLEEQRAENDRLELQVTENLKRVREKLSELKAKRVQLASRQAQTQVMRAVEHLDLSIFDRWESKVGMPDSDPGPDAFEASILREEEKIQLQVRLKSILGKE